MKTIYPPEALPFNEWTLHIRQQRAETKAALAFYKFKEAIDLERCTKYRRQ